MSTQSTTNTLVQTALFPRMTEKVLDDMADYVLVIGALQHQMLEPDAEFFSLPDLRLAQQQVEENERLLNTLWGYLDLSNTLTKRERDQHNVAGIESFRKMLREGQEEVLTKVERSTEALQAAASNLIDSDPFLNGHDPDDVLSARDKIEAQYADSLAKADAIDDLLDGQSKVAGRVTDVGEAQEQAFKESAMRGWGWVK